jgi:two-component system phosphate regulon sensor histidine kinase PhoR
MGRTLPSILFLAALGTTAVAGIAALAADASGLATPLALLAAAVAAVVTAGAFAAAVRQRLRTRLAVVGDVAARYRQGDLTPPALDYGDDEIGAAARALDEAVQALADRIAGLDRDRGRLAAVLAGMIEGVIVVDPQGRLELVNAAARDLLRLGAPAIGRPYVETIRHPSIANLVGTALSGGAPDAVQLSPPRDPGRTLVARAAPTTAGATPGVVLVLHDVTDLKRADRIRRDFVANVSHELRTPLTAVRGYVEALAEGDAGAEERRQFLDVILRHTLRMERLVADLLRLARLDAGQETIEVTSCNTRTLVEGVALDLARALEERGQRLDVHMEPAAERLRADPAKLHDALRNLVANASAYSPAGSAIRIDARAEDDQVAIAVSDEGPGIPYEDLARIFERFYRVDKSRARDPGGTGLGLAIVKHLVELHGGRVEVKNRPHAGATFTIVLAGDKRPGESPAT